MTIHYNVPGQERKALVSAVAKILDCEATYLGVPSCAYQVDEFTIDKDGNLVFSDMADSEIVEYLLESLHERGFDAVDPEDTEEAMEEETAKESATEPTEEEPPDEPEVETAEEPTDETVLEPAEEIQPDEPAEEETLGLTVQMPRATFTESALANLHRLLDAKGSLIRKALGVDDLPVIETEEMVSFPWFTEGLRPEEIQTYTGFISALCELARNQKRVVAKDKAEENEKYAFRCFLLRLGYIGPEYKAQRKLLLSRLSGSSAFRSGQKPEKEEGGEEA